MVTNIINENCMKKFSPSEKKEIVKAFNKLMQMIAVEESYGVPFEKLFNCEAIKYDVLGNNFFTYKAHGRDKAQIRILYKFTRDSEVESVIELHRVSIKRKNDKAYMKDFQEYVDSYR